LAAVVCGGAVAQQALARAASGQEDRHVFQLLMQKLGFAPADASFDAFLYLQSPEFGFLDMQYVQEASWALALPAAGLASVLVLLGLVRRRLLPICCSQRHPSQSKPAEPGRGGGEAGRAGKKGRGGGGGPAKQKKGEANLVVQEADADSQAYWSAWIAELLFLIALIMLAALVNRLRVLAAPILCLVGSLAASPRLWGEALCHRWPLTLLAHILGLVLLAAPPQLSGAVERMRQVGEMQVDNDMYELVQWANQSLPAGTLFMADMTMAAKFRMISPGVRVGNHPQYESLTSRQRNRAYYRTFTCASPVRVHEVLSQYGVTHVLLNANACRARIGKLDPFHEDADKCGQVPAAKLRQKTFCWAGFLSAPPGLFDLAFRNAVYTVLRLGNASDSRGKRSQAKDIASVSTWRPWLAGLKDGLAARGLAHAAARWPQTFGGFDVAEAMQRRAEELAPEDPLVVLQRGELQLLAKDARAAHESMARAAKLAGKEARDRGTASLEDLYRVYSVWKELLIKQRDGAREHVRRLAKSLRGHLEAAHNAFDLCDLAGWLHDLGDKSLARELWVAAKGASRYDQCVREDWARWEGQEPSQKDLWRAFLRL